MISQKGAVLYYVVLILFMITWCQCLLKYCISASCFLAAAKDENVPRFLRLLVAGFFLRE